MLNYPSSPFCLPSSIFTPSTPLASFLPSLTPPFHHLCLFAFASSIPHFSFPFLPLPPSLQSDTAPYSSGKVFFLLFSLSANLSHSLSLSLYFMSQHSLISLSSHFDLSILTLSYLSFLHLLLLIHYRHYCSFFFTFGCFSNIHLP